MEGEDTVNLTDDDMKNDNARKKLRFLNLLEETGYEGISSQNPVHVFETSNLDLLDVLCDSVISSNVVHPEELMEYNVRFGEELDSTLAKHGVDVCDFHSQKENIACLKQEIESYDSTIHDEIINQLSEACKEMEETVLDLRNMEESALAKQVQAVQQCVEVGKRRDSQLLALNQSLSAIATTLTDFKFSASEVHLVAHIPLTVFQEQTECFRGNVKDFIDKQFGEMAEEQASLHPLKGLGQNAVAAMEDELNRLKNGLQLTTYENMVETAKGVVLNTLEQYMQELHRDITKNYFAEELHRFQRDFQEDSQDSSDIYRKMKEVTEEITELEILKEVVAPECLYKEVRMQYWLEKLSNLSNCVKDQLKLVNIVKMLISAERLLVEQMVDIIVGCKQELADSYENYSIRMGALESAKERYVVYKESSVDLHAHLKQCLKHLLNAEENPSLEMAINNLYKDIESKEQHMFTTLACNKDSVFKMEKDLKMFERLVFSGPVKALTCYNDMQAYYTVLQLESSLKPTLNTARKMHKKMLKFLKNDFIKYRRLLWVYFLVNPEMLVATLEKSEMHFNNFMLNSGNESHSPLELPPGMESPLHTSTPKSDCL